MRGGKSWDTIRGKTEIFRKVDRGHVYECATQSFSGMEIGIIVVLTFLDPGKLCVRPFYDNLIWFYKRSPSKIS
jgi:hypothetical protein